MSKWQQVELGDLLAPADDGVAVEEHASYPNVGIFGFGRGLFRKPPISGMTTSAKTLFRIRAGNFIYSRLFAFEGAYGIVDDEFEGHFVSNEYPSFTLDKSRVLPGYLGAYFRCPSIWQAIAIGSKGVGSRRIRVHPEKILGHEIPLPPLAEQQAIIARLDALADKTRQLTEHLDAAEADAEWLLALRFRDAIAAAPYRSMAEVAPAVRRSVILDLAIKYREVGARSFGKGLFDKPDFVASQATWQKPVWIEPGDVVLSNIKAWEGAIALAGDTHRNCIASHRYITCVPDSSLLGAFLLYYLKSEEGLERICEASPGTADRNRTLSLGNLAKIKVAVPPMSMQQSFFALQAQLAALKARHAEIRTANTALLPATLERLFATPSALT